MNTNCNCYYEIENEFHSKNPFSINIIICTKVTSAGKYIILKCLQKKSRHLICKSSIERICLFDFIWNSDKLKIENKQAADQVTKRCDKRDKALVDNVAR